MKKMQRNWRVLLFALALMAGCMMLDTVDTYAAVKSDTYKFDSKNGVLWQTAVRADLNSRYSEDVNVYLQNQDYYIASVKSNKAGLIAKMTYDTKLTGDSSFYSVSSSAASEAKFRRRSSISFYATKKGTYTVTITIKNASKKTVCKKKVTVFAGYGTSALSTLKYAGTTYYPSSGESILTKKASGKLSFKAASTYRIKKVEIATSHDANGDPIFKKVKNGAKITLAKKTTYNKIWYSYEYSNSNTGYAYKYESGDTYDYLKPMTIVRVTYYDTKLKITATQEYSIFNIK